MHIDVAGAAEVLISPHLPQPPETSHPNRQPYWGPAVVEVECDAAASMGTLTSGEATQVASTARA